MAENPNPKRERETSSLSSFNISDIKLILTIIKIITYVIKLHPNNNRPQEIEGENKCALICCRKNKHERASERASESERESVRVCVCVCVRAHVRICVSA